MTEGQGFMSCTYRYDDGSCQCTDLCMGNITGRDGGSTAAFPVQKKSSHTMALRAVTADLYSMDRLHSQ